MVAKFASVRQRSQFIRSVKSSISTQIALQEALETRWMLSATLSASSFSSPAATGATVVPWVQANGGTSPIPDPKEEVIVALAQSPVSPGIEAMLANVDGAEAYPWVGTSLRLYISSDSGSTWSETDVNKDFDGIDDIDPGAPTDNNIRHRVDANLAFDPAGNLYIMSQSEYLGAAVVDRIPAADVASLDEAQGQPQISFEGSSGTQNFTKSGTFVPLLPADDVATIPTGDAPAFAVGADPADPTDSSKTSIYVFNGTSGGYIYAWHGSVDDSMLWDGYAGTRWPRTANSDDGQLEPAVVASDGTLYDVTLGNDGSFALKHLSSPWNTDGTLTGSTESSIANTLTGSRNPLGSTQESMAIDPNTNEIYFAYTQLGRIMIADINPGDSSPSWSVPAQVDTTIGAQSEPTVAVDAATDVPSVVYMTADGDPSGDTTDAWPRMATPSDSSFGGWSHQDLTTQALSGINSGPGTPAYGRYTRLVMDDGVGTAAWSGDDTNLTFASGSSPYVAEAIPVDIDTQTGDVLNVSGGSSGSEIVISRSDATLSVTIDGVAQSFDTSAPIVQIIVDGTAGQSLTVDDSGGAVEPAFGISFVGGGVGTVKVIGSSASDDEITENASFVEMNSGIVNYADAAQVTIQEGAGNDHLTIEGTSLAPTAIVEGSGTDNIAVNLAVNDLPAGTGISVVRGSGADNINLTNLGASAAAALSADEISYGNLTLAYTAPPTTTEIGGDNMLTFSIPDLSSVTEGTADYPGFDDPTASTVTVLGGGESGDDIDLLDDTEGLPIWDFDGYYFDGKVGTIDLVAASSSTLVLGLTSAPIMDSGLSIDLGGGVNTVDMALYTYAYGAAGHAFPVTITSTSGNDTIDVTGRESGSGASGNTSLFTYNAGSMADSLIVGVGIFNNFTFNGGTGDDLLELDYSAGESSNDGTIEFNGNASGSNTLEIIGHSTSDQVTLNSTYVKFSTVSARYDTIDVTHVDTVEFQGGTGDGGSIEVASGSYNLGVDASNAALTVEAGATATFNEDETISTLDIDGGLLQVASESRQLLTVGTLTIADDGQLDLGGLGVGYGSDLVTTGTPVATMRTYLSNGFNGGAWNGLDGIDSTVDANDYASGEEVYALGYLSSDDDSSLPTGEVLVRSTLYGDTNLDLTVDFVDFNAFSNAYGTTGNDWATGDFNYSSDGAVDFADFNLFSNNYLSTYP